MKRHADCEALQARIDSLFNRWKELEAKKLRSGAG
jgi:hypothetical protein